MSRKECNNCTTKPTLAPFNTVDKPKLANVSASMSSSLRIWIIVYSLKQESMLELCLSIAAYVLLWSQIPYIWLTTSWGSHFNSITSLPNPRANSSPTIIDLYSALLLVKGTVCMAYLRISPYGDLSTIPKPDPLTLDAPFINMVQTSGIVHYTKTASFAARDIILAPKSATKSAKAYDMIAVYGLYLISNSLISTAHLAVWPDNSHLWRTFHKGNVITPDIR